ncbi:MAG: ABC transporter ATP-binding protein [Candidatus Wallbacteria bacterium]|nr:ABC transporter ATP-binding protein [Candidatus Wallbacteria bacterium]
MLKELRLLIYYLSRYRTKILFGLILLLIVDGAQLLIPLILKYAVDGLYQGKATLRLLFIFAGLIIGFNLLIYSGRYWWRYFIFGSAFQIERDLRNDYLRHLLTLDMPFFGRQKTGDLMAYATNDITAIMRFCGMGLVALFDSTIMLVAAVFFMLAISPKLTLYILVPLPVISITMKVIGNRLEKESGKGQEIFGKMMDRAREYFNGIKIIQAYNFNGRATGKFHQISADYRKNQIKIWKFYSFLDPTLMLIIYFASSFVIYFGGKDVIFARISLGDFVAFNGYLNIIIWPMIALGWVINLFNRARASVKRIDAILQVKSEYPAPDSAETLSLKSLKVSGLNFSYPAEGNQAKRIILDNVDFEVEPGTRLGIIGTTGSGKSTLFSLLFRLLLTESGSVSYDGYDIRRLSPDLISRNIHYLPQAAYLFSDTVRNNLLFGNPAASDLELWQALKLAKMDQEVEAFPARLDQILGERGVTVSGGQKQRLALARIFLLPKPFYFIDDALSACDADTEKEILSNLYSYTRGSTFIISTARIKTMENMDRILVFDKGRLIESGTHSDLKGKSELYSEIFELQKFKEELEGYL